MYHITISSRKPTTKKISFDLTYGDLKIASCESIPEQFFMDAIGYPNLSLINSKPIKVDIPEYAFLSLLNASHSLNKNKSTITNRSPEAFIQGLNPTPLKSKINSGAQVVLEMGTPSIIKEHIKTHYLSDRHSIIEANIQTEPDQRFHHQGNTSAWNIFFNKINPEIPIQVTLFYQGRAALLALAWDIWNAFQYLETDPEILNSTEFSIYLPLPEPEALFLAAYFGYCKNLKNEEGEECDLARTSANEIIFAGLKSQSAATVYHDALEMLDLDPCDSYSFEKRYDRSELDEFIRNECKIAQWVS